MLWGHRVGIFSLSCPLSFAPALNWMLSIILSSPLHILIFFSFFLMFFFFCAFQATLHEKVAHRHLTYILFICIGVSLLHIILCRCITMGSLALSLLLLYLWVDISNMTHTSAFILVSVILVSVVVVVFCYACSSTVHLNFICQHFC